MKLLDRIALQRLINILLSFILVVLKLVIPKNIEEIEKPNPKKRKRLFPKIFI
jgi:hypothetical protein